MVQISARVYDWKCDCNNGYGSKACDLTACSTCAEWNACTENCAVSFVGVDKVSEFFVKNAPVHCDKSSTCTENCDCTKTDGGLSLCDGQASVLNYYIPSHHSVTTLYSNRQGM